MIALPRLIQVWLNPVANGYAASQPSTVVVELPPPNETPTAFAFEVYTLEGGG